MLTVFRERLEENEVEISLAVKAGANVVQVYGFCFDAPDGRVRIVMELCSNGSLRAHLKALPRDKVRALTTHAWYPQRSGQSFPLPALLPTSVRLACAQCTCVVVSLPSVTAADAAVRTEHLRSTDQRAAAPTRVWHPAPRPEVRQRPGAVVDSADREVGGLWLQRQAGRAESQRDNSDSDVWHRYVEK